MNFRYVLSVFWLNYRTVEDKDGAEEASQKVKVEEREKTDTSAKDKKGTDNGERSTDTEKRTGNIFNKGG